MRRIIMVIGILATLAGAAAYGQQPVSKGSGTGMGGPQGGRGFGPPPEAYAACKGKSEGARAQFTNPEGEVVAGTCRTADGNLVLRPDHPKQQGAGEHQGPPPEAYEACTGKTAGSTSQFVDPRGETVKGTCEDEDGRMVLRPANRKGPQGGRSAAGSSGVQAPLK